MRPSDLLLFLGCTFLPVAFAACGVGNYLYGTTCVPCPANTIASTIDQNGCIPCDSGTQPNSEQSYCQACAPGSYSGDYEGDFLGSLAQWGPTSLRLIDSNLYVTRGASSNVQALPAVDNVNQVFVITNALNNAAGYISFRLSHSPNQYLACYYGENWKVNVSSGANAAWKDAASFKLTHLNPQDPLDWLGDSIRSESFQIQPYVNSSIAISCTGTSVCVGSAVNPLTVGNTLFKADAANTRINSKFNWYGNVLVAPIGSHVSLSAQRDNSHYVQEGADGKAYCQYTVYPFQFDAASFVVRAPLDGQVGSISLESVIHPGKFLSIHATDLAASSPSEYILYVEVPTHNADASFAVLKALANTTADAGFISLRNDADPKAYMYWNRTADRKNEVVFKTFFNTSLISDNIRGFMSFYPARGLDAIASPPAISHSLKSVRTAAQYIGNDGTNLVAQAAVDTTVIEVIPPLSTPTLTNIPWRKRDIISLRMRISSSMQHRYVYMAENNDGGRVPAVTANPYAFGASVNDYLFAVVSSNSTVYPTGIRICSIYNSSLCLADIGSSSYNMRDPVSLGVTGVARTVFYISHPLRSNMIGFNSRALSCSGCAAGTFTASIGASACTNVTAGHFSLFSALAEVACPAGTYTAVGGMGACTPCPAGQYAGSPGATSCTPCGVGTYSSAPGASACTPCPLGTFFSSTGATICTSCTAGTASGATAGATSCSNCLAGTFSAASASVCTNCAAGSYSIDDGASICNQCISGTFQADPGQSSCDSCTAGHYCIAGVSNPAICPNNTYAVTGSSTCTNCGFNVGYTEAPGASSCKDCIGNSPLEHVQGQCPKASAADMYASGRAIFEGNYATGGFVVGAVGIASAVGMLLWVMYAKSTGGYSAVGR